MPYTSAAAQQAVVCVEPWVISYSDGWFYAANPAISLPLKMEAAVFFQSIAEAVQCSREHRPWDRPTAEIISLSDHAATGKSSK